MNAEKKKIRDGFQEIGVKADAKGFGIVYLEARKEKDRLEKLIKEQNLLIEACTQELVDVLEGQNYTSVKLDNGVSMSIKDDVYCTVKDKTAFYTWIDENDLRDLLTVNYQTMSSMVKTKLIDGEQIPDGIATYFKQGVTLRGMKDIGDE